MEAWKVIALVVLIVLLVVIALVLAWSNRQELSRLWTGGAKDAGVKRRDLIERAIAKPPPAEILKMDWPWEVPQGEGTYVYEANVQDGKIVSMGSPGPPHSGIYYVLRDARAETDRSTILTIGWLRFIASATADRVYSWILVDAEEGRYAVRRRARLGDDERDELGRDVRGQMEGDPPHKMAIQAYAKILEKHKFEVVARPKNAEATVRFAPIRWLSDKELVRQRETLMSMSQEDFDKLDWGDIDQKLRPLLASNRERGGDLELKDGKLKVVKLREGLTGHVAHMPIRSPIGFHTHPLGRTGMVEQPSGSAGDLGFILENASEQGLVWHIIVAPEGEYIIAASDSLILYYRESPRGAISMIAAEYDESYCAGAPPMCLKLFLSLIRRIGFVVFFRPDPKWAIDAANLPPYYSWNEAVPEQFFEDFKKLSQLSPEEVLSKYNWKSLIADQEAHAVSLSTWMPVELRDGKITIKYGGHAFSPSRPGRAWEWSRSPAVALYHSSSIGPSYDNFTKQEINAFVPLKERGQLAMLLLTTTQKLCVLAATEKATVIPDAEPDVLDAKRLQKYGFVYAEKKR